MIALSVLLYYVSFLFNLRWLIFISFVPFLFFLKNSKDLKRVVVYGYIYGIFLFGFVNFWLTNVHWLFYVVATLYQAISIALFAIICFFFFKKGKNAFYVLISVPSLWVTFELVRSIGFLGMPAELPNYAITGYLPLAQIASFTGKYGLSFFVFFINVALFLCFQKDIGIKRRRIILSCGILVFIATFLFGRSILESASFDKVLKVSIVQGNIPAKAKWDLEFLGGTITTHENLSKKAAKDNPSLIIWPETAVPCFLLHPERKNILERIENIVKSIKIPHLIGAQDFKLDSGGKHAYNLAILFSPNGQIVDKYYKIKLVPFIEEAPFRWMIPILRRHGVQSVYEPGRRYTIFSVDNVKFSSVICFEGLFPDLVRRFVKEGAQFMVNITNDESSLDRMEFFYHANADMLIVRAIENRRSFIRAANNGKSFFVDPFGRVIKGGRLFTEDYVTADVPICNGSTWYNRFGDIFAYICIIITILNILKHSSLPPI